MIGRQDGRYELGTDFVEFYFFHHFYQFFIGLAVGVVAGLILMNVPDGAGIDVAKNYIKPWGDIFLNLLKFVVVPIVLFSIASGVISMKDISKVGAIGGKTVVYYMCTTAFAVVLALILANIATGMGLFLSLIHI